MKITKTQLKQIVKEETATYLKEERCARGQECAPEVMAQNHWGAILDNPGTLRYIRDDYDNIYKHWCNGGEEVEGYKGKKEFGCKWKVGRQDAIADGLADDREVGGKERLRGELEDFLKHIGGLVYPKGELSPGSLVESKKITKSQLQRIIQEEIKSLQKENQR